VGDLVGQPELLDSCCTIAAADDCHALIVHETHRDLIGALRERCHLEDAHRAVPDDGSGHSRNLSEQNLSFGSDVRAHLVGRYGANLDCLRLRVFLKLGSDHGVKRKNDLVRILSQDLLGVVDTRRVKQRLADLVALSLDEGEGHAAADDEFVDLREQAVDDADLVRNFRSAEDRDERSFRIIESLAQVLDLLLDEEACHAGKGMGHALCRGMGSVGGAKCIVHIEFCVRCQLGAEHRVILLLFSMEAKVLEENDVAGHHRLARLLNFGAYTVGEEWNVLAKQFGQTACHRFQAEFGFRLTLRAAEVAAEDDGCAVLKQVLDGGEGLYDAPVVGDRLTVQRNVEVAAHEHALTLDVDVSDGLLVEAHVAGEFTERKHVLNTGSRRCIKWFCDVLKSMCRRWIVGLALLAISSHVLADRFDDYASETMKAQKAPGLALAVIQKGKLLKLKGYGLANLEHKVPVKADTVFEIGSVSKQFTAIALMMLVEEGKISLDDPFGKYLSDLPKGWEKVTVRQGLTHTGGLAEFTGIKMNFRTDYTVSGLYDIIKDKPLEYVPGTTWSYSNSGYTLAALVIEKVSGKTYADFMAERVFKKLGMTETRIQRAMDVIPNRAQGYTSTGKAFANTELLRHMAGLGAGTVLSSARDMAKWALSLEKRTLLKPESWKAVFEQVKLGSGRPYPYGFGWFLDDIAGHPFIHHGGNTLGQSAVIANFPDEKVWVVALTNVQGQAYEGLASRIGSYLAPELKVKPRVETKDPDIERTYKLIDAMNAFGNQKPNTEFMDDEMIALLQTIRGKATATGLRAAVGKLRSLRYVTEAVEGTDTWVSYVAHFDKRNLNLDLLVSKDRKLVRFRAVP